MLIFHILFVDNLNAEQLFCGSSYRSSLFQQQHLRKSLYLPRVVTDTAAPTMGDKPSAPITTESAAHGCNGDREGLACRDYSESVASSSDGATERSTP